MLYSSFEHIKAITIGSLSNFFSFNLIIGFRTCVRCKIECWTCSPLYMFRMIILWLCVFKVIFFVSWVIVVVIVKGIDLIDISFCRGPNLIVELKIFSLFESGVRLISVAFKASVANYLVDHFEVIQLCQVKI